MEGIWVKLLNIWSLEALHGRYMGEVFEYLVARFATRNVYGWCYCIFGRNSPDARSESTSLEDTKSSSTHCLLYGKTCPKTEIVFFSQVVVLYTVILVNIYNLTKGIGNCNFWTPLLRSSVGYIYLIRR